MFHLTAVQWLAAHAFGMETLGAEERIKTAHQEFRRRRSLTLESHSSPFTGSSLGKCLEQRRQSMTTDDDDSSKLSTLQTTLHSSQAGNLSYYGTDRRRCFIQVCSDNRCRYKFSLFYGIVSKKKCKDNLLKQTMYTYSHLHFQ